MATTITHRFLTRSLNERLGDPGVFAAETFPLSLNRVGALSIIVRAIETETGKWIGDPRPWTLRDPDGVVFTKTTIALADLDHYRDLRGFIRPFSLEVPQVTVTHFQPPARFEVRVDVEVTEALASSSAAPLVERDVVLAGAPLELPFDLYRLGTFAATLTRVPRSRLDPVGPLPVPPHLSLVRPDGTIAAQLTADTLRFAIAPTDLRTSRGPDGAVRPWRLRIEGTLTGNHHVLAQVTSTLRIPTSVLQARLAALFGAGDEKLGLAAEWIDGANTNRFTLTVKDPRLAETFALQGVLRGLNDLLNPGFDHHAPTPIPGHPYILWESPYDQVAVPPFTAQAFFHLALASMAVTMGVSQERHTVALQSVTDASGAAKVVLVDSPSAVIPAGLPMFAIELAMTGGVRLAIRRWGDAGLVVPRARVEVALGVTDGRIAARCWIDPTSVQFGGADGAPPGYGPISLAAKISSYTEDVRGFFAPLLEHLVDRIQGGVFHYTAARWTPAGMELDYLAPVEHERRPDPHYVARGGTMSGGPPASVHDTWSSPNLAKIDHVVVLMMENRSFDHVLGYLSLEREPPTAPPGAVIIPPPPIPGQPINRNVDGLTRAIVDGFSRTPLVPPPASADDHDFGASVPRVRHLRDAAFPANDAGLKTRIPIGVGHSTRDVTAQLAGGAMTGFAQNLRDLHGIARTGDLHFDWHGCQSQDALGYYTEAELPVSSYLAGQYAICDRYFCSHPGPTLPNRMYSICGDLQRDRNGEPRIDNGVDGTFFLSREQTIFDVLSQRGVPWRVYESFPSVTMLRMFSRYAGDETHIRGIDQLGPDVARGDLPAVTFIDPGMHDGPANDDHPPADMLRGQELIRQVYEHLRAKPSVWDKTLLVITYDEHGGFFDHVGPPVAEVLRESTATVATTDAAVPTPHRPDVTTIYGVRVPTFLVSPWVERAGVFKEVVDHASILKTILIRFCPDRPFLSDRVHHANDLGPALTLDAPRAVAIAAPVPPQLPLPRRALPMRLVEPTALTDDRADFHDYLALLGRMVRP